MITFTLNNGRTVLARDVGGMIRPYRYLARQQAEKRAAAVGGTVFHPAKGCAFYVLLEASALAERNASGRDAGGAA